MEFTNTIRRTIFVSLLVSLEILRFFIGKITFNLCPSLVKRITLKILNIDVNASPEMMKIVDDYKFWVTIASGGRVGLAEAYINGYFECDRIDLLYFNVFRSKYLRYLQYFHPYVICRNFLYKMFDRRTADTTWEMGGKHYDVGHGVCKYFVGQSMNYSCGYWRNAEDLETAQLHKMELIAKKLHLRPGMKILDIGCGYGSMAKYLAEKYDVEVVGITVSVEHANYATKFCENSAVDIRLQDYREVNEKFDRIIAVEMIEHIGVKNYREFFTIIQRNLTDDGLLLIHCFGVSDTNFENYDIFFNEHVFLNMYFPRIQDISRACADLLIIEDLHNFGHDYSITMNFWREELDRNQLLIEKEHGSRIFRTWHLLLSTASGAFASRKHHIWHIVFSKNTVIGGYQSVR